MTTIPRWTEVRVLVPRGWHELVADTLVAGGCTSVVVGTTSIGQEPPPGDHELVRSYLHDAADTRERRAELRAALARLAEDTGARELEDLEASFRPIPREDYATSWKKSWKPFRVGRLVVLPPWRDYEPRGDELRLTLEPGGVFGSGRHATTRTCLKVLQERITGSERVLDAGTGSGILAVTAVLLGAQAALGFDVDETSPRYAGALAEENGISARCTFRHGGFGVLTPSDTNFDLVLANIYSDVIQSESASLARRLRPGGCFVFSGCPVQSRPATVTAIAAAGLTLEEERRRGRWCTFVGRR